MARCSHSHAMNRGGAGVRGCDGLPQAGHIEGRAGRKDVMCIQVMEHPMQLSASWFVRGWEAQQRAGGALARDSAQAVLERWRHAQVAAKALRLKP